MPADYRMHFEQILDKPFIIGAVNWDTTNLEFTELVPGPNRMSFPTAIMTNELAKVPFHSATFFQAKMCVMLQVAGTPMHQGLVLVAAVPHGTPRIINPNQILSAPHVFLNASESTSVCLECPMYTPTSLYRCPTIIGPQDQNSNTPTTTAYFGLDVFDLVFFVMNPLEVAVGASIDISISVHCMFKEAEFYVPRNALARWEPQGLEELSRLPTAILDDTAVGLKKVSGDLIDYMRSTIKTVTGFHNKNNSEIANKNLVTFRNPLNHVDQEIHFEKLHNFSQSSRIYDDFFFRTDQDEMDLNYLLKKPVYVGTFVVNAQTQVGKNLFAYPITPMVEITQTGNEANSYFFSIMRTIYENSRFWRGDLKMHIQAVCTNFHFAKIAIFKNYNMTIGLYDNDAFNNIPRYLDVHNLNLDTLEFSAGGQIQTIDLPFCSNFRQLECTKDYANNSVSHGVVFGYLVQPLVFNSNVPKEISFNVYLSGGDNLEFAGYGTDNFSIPAGTPPTLMLEKNSDELSDFVAEGQETLVSPSDQVDLLNSSSEFNAVNIMSMQANKSVRDYVRRLHPLPTLTFAPSTKGSTQVFDIYSLLHSREYSDAFTMFLSHYTGICGGLKFKFKIVGAANASVYYQPPSRYSDPDTVLTQPCLNNIPASTSSFNNYITQASFVPSTKSFPLPLIELEDYVRPYSSNIRNPGGVFTLEFSIPNMNMANFIGNASKWIDTPRKPPDPENDWGAIILCVDCALEIATSPPANNFQPFTVSIFVGLDDEARLGFQVYNPKKFIRTYITTDNPVTIARSSVYRTVFELNNYPSGIPISPMPSRGMCYFFNTT